MSTLHTLRLCTLAGLGPLLATTTFAQEGGYGYVGLSGGKARAEVDQGRITSGLQAEGLTVSNFGVDEKGNAYKLFGGYQFNRIFGVEAGYFRIGKFGFNATTVPAGTLYGGLKTQGFNLDLVATVPLTGSLSAIGRVGGHTHRTQDHFNGTGAVSVLNANPSKRATGYKFGAGLQYEINRRFLLRAEAERYQIDDAVGNRGGINTFTVGVVIPFGRAEPPAPRVAAPYVAPPPPPPPPVVVQAPPPPPPAPVVAPPPPPPPPAPERRRVSFSAESLFGFDQSDIKPEGKAALDTFAGELRGTTFQVITVEGHTDRLGSTAYNQKLSTQRAQTVRNYLVNVAGFEAAKVNAVGKGEAEPVTTPGTCKGNKATRALIACLQPDRRVDVEVTGTR